MRSVHPAWALVAVALLVCCSTPKPHLVRDGTTQVFSYQGGVPMPAKNDWIEMTFAGTAVSTEKAKVDDIPFWWNFAFKAHVDDIKSVTITDVTQAPPVPVSTGASVTLAKPGELESRINQ